MTFPGILGPADISVLVSASNCTPNAPVDVGYTKSDHCLTHWAQLPSFLGTSLPPAGWGTLYCTHLNKSSPLAPSSPQTPLPSRPANLGTPLATQRRQNEGASPPGGRLTPRMGQLRTWAPLCLSRAVRHILQAWESSHRPLFLISLTRRPAPARKQLSSQPIGNGQQGD